MTDQTNKGVRISRMSLFISANSWFEVLALAKAGCTPTSTEIATELERVTFAKILSRSLGKGSVNRGVPRHHAGWVDAVVEGLFPTWE